MQKIDPVTHASYNSASAEGVCNEVDAKFGEAKNHLFVAVDPDGTFTMESPTIPPNNSQYIHGSKIPYQYAHPTETFMISECEAPERYAGTAHAYRVHWLRLLFRPQDEGKKVVYIAPSVYADQMNGDRPAVWKYNFETGIVSNENGQKYKNGERIE